MSAATPFQGRDAALEAGWSEIHARLAGLQFNTPEQVRSVAAMRVPEGLREVILRDTKAGLGEDRVRAFREAAEIVALCNMAQTLPPEMRDPMRFVRAGRVQPLAEVRKFLQEALADRDEHIDTSMREGTTLHAIGAATSIVDRAAMVRVYGEEAVARMENAK